MTAATADVQSDSAYTRLHVTPLDPELTKVVLSAAILPRARNISYHHLETFPEKRYGFVDLPTEDAEKLKKKFHGSVVKGVKLRIERARPERIPTPLGAEAMGKRKESEGKGAGEPKLKKRKRDAELEGVVLEEGRKVKRGWTTTTDEKKARKDKKENKDKKDKRDKKDKKERKQLKSKYTDHPECLVKTVLPPNATEGVVESRSKKKKGKSREVIIHEFEKTTKFPTFLKSTADKSKQKATVEFVEGKGWVDEAGNVVETVKASRSQAIIAGVPVKNKSLPKEVDSSESSSSDSDSDSEPEPAHKTSSTKASSTKPRSTKPTATPNDESSSSESSDPGSEAEPPAKTTTSNPTSKDDDDSSSDSGSDSDSDSDSDSEPPSSPRPKSSSSAKNLTIRIPPATPPKEPSIVHPLEALYKRPADSTTTQGAGFSFFAGANDDIEEDPDTTMTSQVPMTPFSRQDFENRGLRSAAPTPDTAHPNRRLAPWDQEEDDIIEDEENEEDEQIRDGSPVQRGGETAPSSDFQKWFWENRGDINRSWRKRRKTAGKEKRYRENRARMARAI